MRLSHSRRMRSSRLTAWSSCPSNFERIPTRRTSCSCSRALHPRSPSASVTSLLTSFAKSSTRFSTCHTRAWVSLSVPSGTCWPTLENMLVSSVCRQLSSSCNLEESCAVVCSASTPSAKRSSNKSSRRCSLCPNSLWFSSPVVKSFVLDAMDLRSSSSSPNFVRSSCSSECRISQKRASEASARRTCHWASSVTPLSVPLSSDTRRSRRERTVSPAVTRWSNRCSSASCRRSTLCRASA
mmetsp:Transcript_25983/g.68167  ORF Transcript_25983/g.68167 Transcript_25983/m.68167 type:complete len:240 (+) Transcript_25983:1196-1915(+)